MRTRLRAPLLAALLPLVVLGVGCNLVRAKAAFKDGNRLYKEENYRKAIDFYQRAVELKPDFAEAHFYLASSQQSLYRPGKEGDENKQRLDKAIEHYEKSLEVNKADNPNLQQLRLNTLGALTAIYSDPPLTNYEKALSYAEQLVQGQPERHQEPLRDGQPLREVRPRAGGRADLRPGHRAEPERRQGLRRPRRLLQQAAVGRRRRRLGRERVEGRAAGEVRDAIATLERCAGLDAADPSGYYKLAMFFWDKAYRDPLIGDKEKNEYADKGIATVDTALGMKPDYWEAIITKGLLYRVKAQVATNPAERKQYLEQAVLLQKQAMDLRKETQARGRRPTFRPRRPPRRKLPSR